MSRESDNISLQDEAFLIELLGDDAALLNSRLEQFNAEEELKQEQAKIAAITPTELKKTVTAKTGDEHFDSYMTWLDGEMDFVRETLEAIYPGNVDVIRVNNFSETDKRYISTGWNSCNGNIANITGNCATVLGGRQIAEVLIHFPEFVITNTKQQKHTIRDMYIQIKFLGSMKFIEPFRGIRTTKTYAEYSSGYSHSHLNVNQMQTSPNLFCLGSTEFKSLVTNLSARTWDRLMFEMFAIQLGDYLKWESLEGGPYARIGEIRSRSSSNNRWNQPGNHDLLTYYNEFLKKNRNLPINVEDTGHGLRLTISKDLEFWRLVTHATSEVHRLPFNELKMEIHQEAEDESEWGRDIAAVNATLARQACGIKFKGVPLSFKLYSKNNAQQKDKKDYMAHESVVNHIHTNLERKLNEHLQNEFCK